MQLVRNPFLVPITAIGRPNPFQLMKPATPGLTRPNPFQLMKPATPGLTRPNPKRRNPWVPRGLGSTLAGSAGAALASTGLALATRSKPALYPWGQAAVCLLATATGKTNLGAAFAGASYYALFSHLYYRNIAGAILTGAHAATAA